VIVIDNASADGSAEMAAAEFPGVRLIANPDNRGFAAANNQGLEIARGRNLLLLNPDTVVLDGAIDRMLAWLADHPRVGCVGCQSRTDPDTVQVTAFADLTPANLAIEELGLGRFATLWPRLGRPWYAGWDRTTPREVEVVSGMFMLVPRAVLETVGPLDARFFIYAEEADWCRRIRAAGWVCAFEPSARILHLDGGGKSTDQVKAPMHVEMQRSKLLYVAKHHGAGWAAAMRALYAVSAALRLAVFGPLGALTGRARHRARARLARAALVFHLTGRGAVA
jgi:GT2 family glycosyltransferase